MRKQSLIRRVPVLLMALLLGAGSMSGLPAAGQASVQGTQVDPRFGVVEAWRAPAQAKEIGVGWERLTFWWKNLQPDGPDSYNLWATDRDHQIHYELSQGRQLAGLLINTPDWAALHPEQHGSSVPKGLYLPYNDPKNYWGHFIKLIVAHYRGEISDWIIWNEVDIEQGKWSTWRGSVADYAQLVKVAYLAARSVNPDAHIVLFGDPYWYDYGAFFNQLLHDLTSDLGAAANNAYFDAANLHLYSRPRDYQMIITLYNSMLAHYHLHKPMWLSETNAIPYNDPVRLYPRAGFFATLDDQASYIPEAFALALALNVRRIEVNRMIDGTDFNAGGEPFGLLRNDMSPRPVFWAYRAVTTLYAGVTGGTISYSKTTGIYSVTLYKPGAVLTVAWDQNPIPATIAIKALGASAVVYDKFGHGKTVLPHGGSYTFPLAQSTGNTDQADPKDYVMGGSPVILVQAR